MTRNTFICINGRYTYQRLTGVQRYAHEVSSRFVNGVELLIPPDINLLKRGPFWEQFFLPSKINKHQILWSPANTGPLQVKHQVVTIHDLTTLENPEWFSRRFSSWYQFLLPQLVKRVMYIITDSLFSRQRMIELLDVPEWKVKVIPLGVSNDFNQTKGTLSQPALSRKPYLLNLGSLEPRKNLPRLLLAWEKNTSLHKYFDLVIAGDKGFPFRNLDLGELPENVRMLGRIEDCDLPALYSGATAFIYPSIYEGFGLPVLEAMACGTPVIASNATALPEVVGEAGLLVDPYNVDEIAAAIEKLISDSDLQHELRQRGLERAAQFSWDKTAEMTWQVLTRAYEEING